MSDPTDGGSLRKLSPEAKRHILSPDYDEAEQLRVLVKVDGPPTHELLTEMEACRLHIDSTAGDVLSGRIEAGAVQQLSELSHVVSIQLSRPLRSETEQTEHP